MSERYKSMFLPENVKFIINTLNEHGFEAYAVGGCVRDGILGFVAKDFDITTSAKPEEVKSLFESTYDTGIKHGTITVRLGKETFEVTTYRIDEGYKDFRHPDKVLFTQNLAEDLKRRDFTMNAIAYHEKTGFIDLYSGIDDIKNKIIRGVGDPDLRFKEDALRMLRCIRFSAQLGFDIEKETEKAVLENISLIKNVSIERIREELFKIFSSKYLERLNLLFSMGFTKNIFPEMNMYTDSEIKTVADELKSANGDELLNLAIFLQFCDDCVFSILKKLKLDSKTLKTLTKIFELRDFEVNNDRFEIKKFINENGKDVALYFLYLKSLKNNKKDIEIYNHAKEIVSSSEPLFIKDLKITGKDLLQMGFEKGENIGIILNNLLTEVLKNPENNNTEYLISISQKYK